jgi:GNAT superfamily N-acetyltransferase
MGTDTPFVLVAPGHPSLDGALARFCDELQAEPRWFGRKADRAARPSTALVRRLAADGPGICLAAVRDGELIGLARVDLAGPCGAELLVAVAAPWRRMGVALALGREVVGRAHASGIQRIVMRTGYRGAELRELGASLGFHVVDLGEGRVDLVRVLTPDSQTA